ncbi:MAG: hypothetical protein KAJ29_08130 [Alphaproteobacteria bacterium]|nr:hypothetical protein [Alphaproteobacteria bacterium]
MWLFRPPSNGAEERKQELLDIDIKHINRYFHYTRVVLDHDFEKSKLRWVEEARKNGAEKPEVAAYSRYLQQQANIEAGRENALQRVHENHGIPYDLRIIRHQTRNQEM